MNLEVNNISAIDYCLSDLINYDFDRIIIGVNNYNDLKYLDFKFIYNCHISQPFLKPFNKNTINHNLVLNQL